MSTPEDKKYKRRVHMRRGKLTRDGVIFIFGLGGIIHETLFSHSERPTLLLLFGAMIGLPAFLRLDEKKNGK
jgi:hypothetical protein